ncbi:MAG: DUF2293 domain-containing protein [Pseudomonadota bacterium]
MTTKRQKIVNETLTALAPMMPMEDGQKVRAMANRQRLRSLQAQTAVWLSLVAYIRHVHTDYDEMLDDGYDRDSARHFVLDDINDVIQHWQGTRFLTFEDDAMDADIPVEEPLQGPG